MASTNPLVMELSKPEIMDDSEKQLKLLNCTKNQLKNNLLDVKEVISPLVKLVASNNSSVKVKIRNKLSISLQIVPFNLPLPL